MKFKTAIGLMCEGKKIRRREWGKDEWIGLQGFNMHSHIEQKDFVQDDWDLYEEQDFPILFIEAWEHLSVQPEFTKSFERILKKIDDGNKKND
jgi:hypothetical protein